MKSVRVLWVDSNSPSTGWTNEENSLSTGVVHCSTVGMLLSMTAKEIIIVQSECTENKNYHNQIAIPMEAVKKIQELKGR